MAHEAWPGEILRVLVGSHAHGLAGPESDRDERAVVVWPTKELPGLRLGARYVATERRTGAVELVTYEVGHLLELALRANPTVLELFRAPVLAATDEGQELRALFPAVWDSALTYRAFRGYASDQRRRLAAYEPRRRAKAAVACLRVLYQGVTLLTTGDLPVRVAETEVGPLLRRWRAGEGAGEVEAVLADWQRRLDAAYAAAPAHPADRERVQAYLWELRRRWWDGRAAA